MLKFLLRIIFISAFVTILVYYYQPINLFDKNDLARIKKESLIVFGARVGPTSYYEVKNKLLGFEYELMEEFSKYINVDLNIIQAENVHKSKKLLYDRDIDILVGFDINENDSDAKRSYPYHRIDYYIVSNSRYTSIDSMHQILESYDIHTINSPTITTNLDILKKSYNKLNYKIWDNKNIDELLNKLIKNDIRLIVLTSDEFKLFKKYYNNLEIVYRISSNEALSWLLPSNVGKDLEKKLTEFFSYLIKNNKLNNIYSKYFRDNTHTFVGTKIFLNDYINIFPKYEFHFFQASKKFGLDWKLLASIGYQESRWDDKAISYTGVRGLMMLTNDTAKELGVLDRIDPKQSIYGGAEYLNKLLKRLPDGLADDERIWFAVAAYNIGMGHVLDAVTLAQNDGIKVSKWTHLEPYILKLSQSKYYKKTKYGYARGWETAKYIQNIKRYYDILVFLDSQDKKDTINESGIPKSL